MAGRDASTQLGGMLSQIGNTLASRSAAGQGLMSPIRNTFRPGLDPNHPASQQQMAQVKTRIGETDQARMFMEQSRYQAAEQRRVRAEQKAEKRLVASQQIARLQTRADEILANPNLTPQQKELALQGLQNAINTLAEEGGVDPAIGYASFMNDAYNRNAATRMQDLNLSDAELSTMQQQARMDIFRLEADLSAATPGSPEAARVAQEIQTLATKAGLPRQEWADPVGRIAREKAAGKLALRRDTAALREIESGEQLERILALPPGSQERLDLIEEIRPQFGKAAARAEELEQTYTSRAQQIEAFRTANKPFDFPRDEDGKITGKSPELESMLEGLPPEAQARHRSMAASGAQSSGMVREQVAALQLRTATLQINEEYSGELRLADQRARLAAGISALRDTIGKDRFNYEGLGGFLDNPLATAMNERAEEITDEDRLTMIGMITSTFGADAEFNSVQVAWAFASMLQNEQKAYGRTDLKAVDETVAEMFERAGGKPAQAPIPEADDPPSPEYQAAQRELDLD